MTTLSPARMGLPVLDGHALAEFAAALQRRGLLAEPVLKQFVVGDGDGATTVEASVRAFPTK